MSLFDHPVKLNGRLENDHQIHIWVEQSDHGTNHVVKMDFPGPLQWFAVRPDQAEKLAQQFLAAAAEARQRDQARNG